MKVVVSIAFHEGYEAGYYNRPGNPYPAKSVNWLDFDAGFNWGRHGAELPGRKGAEHFKLSQALIYTLIVVHSRSMLPVN